MSDAILPIKRAFLGVADDTGLAALAQSLVAAGVALYACADNAHCLRSHGFPVAAEMSLAEINQTDDTCIDLLVINWRPFAPTIAPEHGLAGVELQAVAVLRVAAVRPSQQAVVVNAEDYLLIGADLSEHRGLTLKTRYHLAARAFAYSAAYEQGIANALIAMKLPSKEPELFPDTLALQFQRVHVLRYGENPHQQAALYHDNEPNGVANAAQLQGKALSYNNLADADTAWSLVQRFDEAACVIVKHTTPCGVALGASVEEAYRRALQADPTSAFGGVIAFNRPLDGNTAQAMVAGQFVEVLVVPALDEAARTALARKRQLRVLLAQPSKVAPAPTLKRISGGLLVQQADMPEVPPATQRIVSRRAPTPTERADLLFAWQVVRYVKSNAIVLARDSATIGIGGGQTSRVFSARIAAVKAAAEGLNTHAAVLASDGPIPFRDGIDSAHESGIRAVIQTGGSRRDAEVIEAADDYDMAMIFTDLRHFRH